MDILDISGFKCFKSAKIPINNLTVLAGANGTGKSTTIQALLFIRQTVELGSESLEDYYVISKVKKIEMPLNSNYMLSLGNSSSVINKQSTTQEITISLNTVGQKRFVFSYYADEFEPKLYLDLKSAPEYTANIAPFLKREFYYLNAERIGPRISHKICFTEYPNVGHQGEHTAQVISNKGGFTAIEKNRLFNDTLNPNLEFQVNEWLNYIMPGTRISAKQTSDTLTSQIRIENNFTKGDPTLATNIGFGISYVLPIIVTGLIAKVDSYFIIENPEAHLHPSAQSKIGFFLAVIANCGVQVIIETHSDHILSGIQIAVAKKRINHKKVTVNFFHESSEDQPLVESIDITEKAELTRWPRGFFDQTQSDFANLIRLRK